MFRLLILLTAFFCVADASFYFKSKKCNVFKKDLVWVLDDCRCRPIRNPCLLEEENEYRLKNKRKPLVPISEQHCRYFIPSNCPSTGRAVLVGIVQPDCGCASKSPVVKEVRYRNWCMLLRKFALEKIAFVSYRLV